MKAAVSPDDPASFAVVVASTLPVTYQWYFNGDILIPGATGDTLLLNNSGFANEGFYTVTNSLGSVTRNPPRLYLDADGNGLGDTWEQQYFGNLDQKANSDFDGDHPTSFEEFTNGTDPTVRDPYHWTTTSGDFDDPNNWNSKYIPNPGHPQRSNEDANWHACCRYESIILPFYS